VATLVEWDEKIPELEVVHGEVLKARRQVGLDRAGVAAEAYG
jgi:hypothetical protein